MTYDTGSLMEILGDAVRRTTGRRHVAIAFSGGLDSGILAAMAKGHARSVTLYTVGSEGSHDLAWAPAAAEELGMRLVTITIGERDVRKGLREMIDITRTTDPVTLSFELPLFFVLKGCAERVVVTGQGADELFAGYSKYVGMDRGDMLRMRAEDMGRLYTVTIPHENAVAEHFDRSLYRPFLHWQMMSNLDRLDLTAPVVDPASRKRPLRELAGALGISGIAAREKKSAQYSSGAMALIRNICKEDGVTFEGLIASIYEELW
ncbi:MAG: asparagine synthase-related protein [Methanomassiliicoccaceae archaeon]|nr:asparagine synthase-related protein [Methanomassiliicoccaceae archaeon]